MTRISPELLVPPRLPPHVKKVVNRLGRPYYYLTLHRGTTKQGQTIRLPDDPKSPEFWTAYARLLNLPSPKVNENAVRELDRAWGGTWDEATRTDVGASPEWKALGKGTKREWRRHRTRIVAAWGDLETRGIEPKHVLALRDAWADTPATANNLMRCLSSMMSWSVPRGWRNNNPCREIKPVKGSVPYAPWPWDVIEAAEVELREKQRADLWWVVAVALYTGQRLGDCLAMRWSAISADGLSITVLQEKTRKELTIALHRDLRAVLELIPKRSVNILTNTRGIPWRGFQMAWGDNKPKLVVERGLVFHGLRKSAVVTLLEAGCTEAEVAAVTGQSMQMVAHYAKQVNQKKLARAAVLKWEQSRT
jgi:integrase